MLSFLCTGAFAQSADGALELSRPVRPWQFMGVFGQRSAILGRESGHLEAWAYPLKILRDFHLNFIVDGETQPADSLVRSIIVRPSSTTLIYANDTFTVRETITVPIDQPAALIRLDIQTAQPLDVQAVFQHDFQLEWPAGMGGSNIDWDPHLKAFIMADEQRKFEAVVGSPTATDFHVEYESNYSSSPDNSFNLGVVEKGDATKIIVIAATAGDHIPAAQLYRQTILNFSSIFDSASRYYTDRLKNNVQLTLPDPMLQQAYEWAQIGMIQGIVDNRFLGTGLVAGYRTSGDDERPGYAWFFGRDALWISLALDAEGDFATTRTALDFLTKYQRADGKIAHEISQSASFVPWFTGLPFAYSSADATPLYIIAANDYVQSSGDVQFAQQHWDNLWKAYQFLLSTYDANGLPMNTNVGHGWVETGPLLPIKTELYQSGVGAEAIRSLASLAHVLHKDDLSRKLSQDFDRDRAYLNTAFWIPDQQQYAFGLNAKDQKVNVATVMPTVPMWFGLLDSDKADRTITQLAAPDFQTDWGMRILSSRDPLYDPGGYHSGTVWPLFSGWASVAEYRYHRSLAAFSNLETNALLTFGGVPGHITEVLSGNYYQTLATASPAQVWSSAMVVSPLLKGLLGLDANALAHTLVFAPHVPPGWTHFSASNIKVGDSVIALKYTKTASSIQLQASRSGNQGCNLEFSPAIGLRARVRSVLLDGSKIPFQVQTNANDQHVTTHFAVTLEPRTLTIQIDNSFGLTEPVSLPLPGTASRGVRVTSKTWTPDHNILNLRVAGLSGENYNLDVWNPEQIASVDGAALIPDDADHAILRLQMPASATETNVEKEITIHFGSKTTGKKRRAKD
ncbi:MAG: amylo-alpha-1,6-glucosidase [Silvibacterium sp.]